MSENPFADQRDELLKYLEPGYGKGSYDPRFGPRSVERRRKKKIGGPAHMRIKGKFGGKKPKKRRKGYLNGVPMRPGETRNLTWTPSKH